jgi:hypothetical protein
MIHLLSSATDQELVVFVDEWAALMEREDYEAAFAHTDHIAEMKWTASPLM